MILDAGRPLRRSRLGQAGFYLWGVFASAAVLAVFCALWQAASAALGEFVLPAPLPVFRRVADILTDINAAQIPVTAARAALGISLALAGGIALGLTAGLSKTLALFCRPGISILLGMPPIIWVVLALFWFGMGGTGTVFTIAVTVAPLTFAAAMRGMMTVDTQLKEMLQAYCVPWPRRIHDLYLPHLLNHLLPAVGVAVGMGIKLAIMAELLGTDDGIGAQLASARAMLDMEAVLAYVAVVLAMIFIVEYLIIEPLKIILMPWEHHNGLK
ncbi:MAG: ABC transporter permease subunit [Neisseria sp.]|nr:ABC transporter permease subunit [Neisseria sp.]